MKYATHLLLVALFLSLSIQSLFAQKAPEDKTLSPYFFVKNGDKDLEQLPLLSTSASVNIAGVIADVTITQVYKNEGSKPIEAIYVFPASTRAAIYGMKMKVGNRIITAEIQERGQARRTYEKAKEDGKRASLLEQERPNVFQMNVANIQPGDQIEVELNYTELIVPTNGTYHFVYPSVVGPRYSNIPADKASGADRFLATPYTKEKQAPTYSFDINLWLSAGLPLQDVTCTSHKTIMDYDGSSTVSVNLDPAEKAGGNRDFILNYRLAGDQIQQGLLLFEQGDENYFLLMMQPPKRVQKDQIPPREYVFIVDVSGSMNGFPLDISKKLMRNLLTGLRPNDKFNILLFAGTSALLSERSLTVTKENIENGIGFIERQQGGGGTELLPALQRALALPRTEEGVSRSMVVVTDGYIGMEKAAFDIIRNNLANANLFAFGIGSSVNRHLIEGMAHVGQGEPTIITKQEEAAAAAEKFRIYIQSPVLTRIKAEFAGFAAFDVEPSAIPDVMAERPVVIFGKYKGKAKGNINIKGFSGKKKFNSSFAVSDAKPDPRNAALRYLWARERIRLISDYNNLSNDPALVKEITDLGLKHNLMTAYTSFVAVDREVVKGDQAQTVKQPLPLPQGVSDNAIGFSPAIERIIVKGIQNQLANQISLEKIWLLLVLLAGMGLMVFGWMKLR